MKRPKPIDGHVVGKPQVHEGTLEAAIFTLKQVKARYLKEAEISARNGYPSAATWEAQANGVQGAIQALDLMKRPDYQAAGHYKYHGD